MIWLLLLACKASEPAPAPTPTPTPTPEPAPEGRRSAARHDWTADVVEVRRVGAPTVVLTEVRTGQHEDFDRVVFELEGGLPGYHVEYVDSPVHQCGSGKPTEIAGDGWLEIRMTPAVAHTEQGEPTVADRERILDLPIVKEIERTCDFEGNVTWVIGTASPNPFRVQELLDPQRVVVDIQH